MVAGFVTADAHANFRAAAKVKKVTSAMMGNLRRAFEPIRLRRVEIPNRQ